MATSHPVVHMCLLLFAVQALACESDKKHSAATSAGVETGSSSESGGASTGPAVTPCDERMTAEACADGGVIDSVLRCRWQGNIATWTAQDACPSLPGGGRKMSRDRVLGRRLLVRSGVRTVPAALFPGDNAGAVRGVQRRRRDVWRGRAHRLGAVQRAPPAVRLLLHVALKRAGPWPDILLLHRPTKTAATIAAKAQPRSSRA